MHKCSVGISGELPLEVLQAYSVLIRLKSQCSGLFGLFAPHAEREQAKKTIEIIRNLFTLFKLIELYCKKLRIYNYVQHEKKLAL